MEYRTIHTTYGLQRLAAAEASGVAINLVQMAVGDGNGADVTLNPDQTFLARERYRATLNSLSQDAADPSKWVAELVVPASEGGFTIREVGLYDDQGALVAVSNTPATYKPTASEGSFADTVIRMVFVVSNADVVNVVADPNVTVATQSWIANNVTGATIIPGGLANQFLAKETNADGAFQWVDPTEGIIVAVYSREETQTLAAGQTVVDLSMITSLGVAVYIEGTRLRSDEFEITNGTRVTLASAHVAGAKITVVQNEEVGLTDMLLRPNNLSDILDKAAARNNLGLPTWLASQNIAWAKLTGVPSFASRWATWEEVTGKPISFPPSSHNQDWSTITGKPETATRWPTWGEVTNKPTTFTPASHSHPVSQITGMDAFLRLTAASLNSNGYATMQAVNGTKLTLQWGRTIVGGDSTAQITWPIPFPGACLAAFACLNGGFSPTQDAGCGIYNQTATGATIAQGTANTTSIMWFAIGF